MIVVPDDEIYRVDEVFLGPERFRFPFRWTYRQWGVAVVTFLALQGLERQIGIPFGLWSTLFSLLVVVWVARLVHDGINWDRGIKVMATEARLELSGPREQTKTMRTVLKAGRARKARERVMVETYGRDERTDHRHNPEEPSWWSQFRRTNTKKTKKRKQSVGPNVHDQWYPEYEPRRGDGQPVSTHGGQHR